MPQPLRRAFAACLLVVGLAGPVHAQPVRERLDALRFVDPDLYAFIVSAISAAEADVDGGFDLAVTGADLACDGLDRCAVRVGIDLRNRAPRIDRRDARVEVECAAGVAASDGRGGRLRETAEGSEDVRLEPGETRSAVVVADARFPVHETVAGIEVERVECGIVDVR